MTTDRAFAQMYPRIAKGKAFFTSLCTRRYRSNLVDVRTGLAHTILRITVQVEITGQRKGLVARMADLLK